MQLIKQAINEKDFVLLGITAESNALALHATMQSARPSIVYSKPETLQQLLTNSSSSSNVSILVVFSSRGCVFF